MDMTITKSQRDLLIGLAGVLIAVLCWFLVASPTMEKRTSLENENNTLRPKAEEYQAVHARVDEYKSSITALDVEKDELVSHLPPKVERQDQLMFWANMAASYPTDLRFDDIELGDWDAVAVAGLDESSVDSSVVKEDEDGNPTIADSDVPELEADFKLYGATMDMNFASSYTGLKLLFNYIYSQNDKNSIQGIDVTYDEEDGYLQGELFMELFYVEGTDREYVPAFIPSVPTGVDDLFHTEGMGLADILKAAIEKAMEESNAKDDSETKEVTADSAPAYLRKGDATVYHTDRDCEYIKGKEVDETTVGEAKKSYPKCKKCAN